MCSFHSSEATPFMLIIPQNLEPFFTVELKKLLNTVKIEDWTLVSIELVIKVTVLAKPHVVV